MVFGCLGFCSVNKRLCPLSLFAYEELLYQDKQLVARIVHMSNINDYQANLQVHQNFNHEIVIWLKCPPDSFGIKVISSTKSVQFTKKWNKTLIYILSKVKCMKKLVTASIDDTCSIDNFIERKIHGQWSLWALSFCNEVNNQSQGFLKMFLIDCFVLRNSTKVFSAWCKIFMPDTKWYLSQFFHTLESKMPIFFFWENTFFCSWHTAGRKLGHFNHLNLIM